MYIAFAGHDSYVLDRYVMIDNDSKSKSNPSNAYRKAVIFLTASVMFVRIRAREYKEFM